MIQTHRFAAAQVLSVREDTEGKLGVPFLNWRVSPRPMRDRAVPAEQFEGYGLYGVCFRGRLVYVGSYCGKKPSKTRTGAYASGDVVKNRWWQHIGSLTARGHRLHVSQQVLGDLRQVLTDHPLILGLCAARPAIHRDDGCLGAENRLRFASRNWSRFSTMSASDLVGQFSFIYARHDGSPRGGSPAEMKHAVEAAETEAIAVMQPEVNTAKRERAVESRRISPRMALSELSQILERHLAQCGGALSVD